MAVFDPNIKIDLTDFVISVDKKNLLSDLVVCKTKVRINGVEMKFAKAADLYSSCVDYVVTDDNGKPIHPIYLTAKEIEQYQHAPYTITPACITKRIYGKFAITIDVTPDEPTPAHQKPCGDPDCACS